MNAKKKIYKIIFTNQGKIYEMYAHGVSHGALFGFIEIEGLIFGEKTSLVIDPSEEVLEAEFRGVNRTYLPMHAIHRIDEVEKEGVNKVIGTSKSDNIAYLPGPIVPPSNS